MLIMENKTNDILKLLSVVQKLNWWGYVYGGVQLSREVDNYAEYLLFFKWDEIVQNPNIPTQYDLSYTSTITYEVETDNIRTTQVEKGKDRVRTDISVDKLLNSINFEDLLKK